MPVTIRTQPIDGDPWLKTTTADRKTVFKSGWRRGSRDFGAKGIMQSSLDEGNGQTSPGPNFTPATNGLVDATIEAWNNHHHLVLRPDDIWLSILSQLGFFITTHAEELRGMFVAHQGKKELSVQQEGHPDAGVDYGLFAQQMSDEMSKHVKDPDLVPWIMPNFTTTTDTDRVVGSVLLMGAMQHYFIYNFDCCTCGIPSITLLGERADWVDLQERINKIPRLGGEAIEFHRLLAPIARHMVLSFDKPTSKTVLKFWRVIASREYPKYGGSGGPAEFLTGWITTFCFWRANGVKNNFLTFEKDQAYELDEVEYWPLEPDDKVSGWASTPVSVRWFDSGRLVEVRKCRMVAGSIGMRPGRHAEMGVRLEGLPLPRREGVSGDDDESDEEVPGPSEITEKKKTAPWKRFLKFASASGSKPEAIPPPTQEKRAKKEKVMKKHDDWTRPLIRSQDQMQAGAPSLEAGFDAVQPHVGWWIFHEKEKNEGADDADSDGVIR